ncbi:MAG: hemolysin III family protein [Ruthenibacterium sp.]
MHDSQNPTQFYTKGEEIFNAVSHGVGSLLALIGTSVLVTLAACFSNVYAVIICIIYGLSLIMLYTMSTLYHAFPFETVKRVFRIFDHSTIYLLIAGSYTPLTLLLMPGSRKAMLVCGVVWATALLGIILNAYSVDKFEKLSLFLYVAMGWAVVFMIGDIVKALAAPGLWLLLIGGLCYTGGIVFYKWKVRYMHSVWHLFVLAGSVSHFFCVALYVLPLSYVR